MKKIKVGDILYEEVNGEIKQHTVTKLGKKYFYTQNDKCGFSFDLLKYEDKVYLQSNIQLYRSVKEIEDKNRKRDLLWKVRSFFNDFSLDKNVTLQQLESITKILNIEQ